MDHPKGTMIVEAKVLFGLQQGSYEELLQALDQAVAENQEMFGASDSVLFASFPKYIVVMNEGGQFFKVAFENKDGVVVLGESKTIDVSVLSEDELASMAVDKYFDGGSLAESLREIVKLRRNPIAESPLEKVEQSLLKLFSGGQIWRKHISEKREQVGRFAWDANFGKLEIDIRPVFGELIDEDELDEDSREQVVESLLALEGRLHSRLTSVQEAYEKYQRETSDMRDDEADSLLSQFESFAMNYIDHLAEISSFVSRSVQESNEGCIICAAFVHDEVAKRFKELELGGRFVRKISSQFTQ